MRKKSADPFPGPFKNSCSGLFQQNPDYQSIMQRNPKITFFHLKKSPGFPVLDIFGLSIFEKLFDFFVFDICDFLHTTTWHYVKNPRYCALVSTEGLPLCRRTSTINLLKYPWPCINCLAIAAQHRSVSAFPESKCAAPSEPTTSAK